LRCTYIVFFAHCPAFFLASTHPPIPSPPSTSQNSL
jgi:hypothetical protein